MPWIHISSLKSPFPYLKGSVQFLNEILDTVQVVVFISSQDIRFSSDYWSIMKLVPIAQGNPNHNQKILKGL